MRMTPESDDARRTAPALMELIERFVPPRLRRDRLMVHQFTATVVNRFRPAILRDTPERHPERIARDAADESLLDVRLRPPHGNERSGATGIRRLLPSAGGVAK
jgi:hypothetical protein